MHICLALLWFSACVCSSVPWSTFCIRCWHGGSVVSNVASHQKGAAFKLALQRWYVVSMHAWACWLPPAVQRHAYSVQER